MVTPTEGSVVLIPFPFSDLSNTKLRPAIVLAAAQRNDWILCQVTSKVYADPKAIAIVEQDFAAGSLQTISYARPGKLFTANQSLLISEVGSLKNEAFARIINAVISLLQSAITKR